ncbi:hypothetical protein ALC57_02514 [Trachymyrmex cornetzi]|uniref:Uncharacterized protein n=1 Tax=Trachymyrmex cornetzi TaxID=471704 RepID=A0A195EIJ5_9HYME|nr:hypothetical protein ALC57_02514 [Trachymyrmex cornetzi]
MCEGESTRSTHTEVKTKRDATGARDPKSAKRHGVARELNWANGLPKIQRTWRKSGRVKSVDVNVNPTRNSICISAEDTVGLNRMGSFSVEAYNNPLVQWVKLRGAFGPRCNLDCLGHQRQQYVHHAEVLKVALICLLCSCNCVCAWTIRD